MQFTSTFSQPALSSSSPDSDFLYYPKLLLTTSIKGCQLVLFSLHTLACQARAKKVSFSTSDLQLLLMNAPCLLVVLHYGLVMPLSQEILISLCLLILRQWQQYPTLTLYILVSWEIFLLPDLICSCDGNILCWAMLQKIISEIGAAGWCFMLLLLQYTLYMFCKFLS